ncbi:hypothetical protein LIER_41918 [Lithospermum erythrorhizon]|uniref:Uncharacterized protein n=1 Tax=Lithospermum erythrorhizon TaxID=34254 RepID=A0AAV3RJL0_LITER
MTDFGEGVRVSVNNQEALKTRKENVQFIPGRLNKTDSLFTKGVKFKKQLLQEHAKEPTIFPTEELPYRTLELLELGELQEVEMMQDKRGRKCKKLVGENRQGRGVMIWGYHLHMWEANEECGSSYISLFNFSIPYGCNKTQIA